MTDNDTDPDTERDFDELLVSTARPTARFRVNHPVLAVESTDPAYEYWLSIRLSIPTDDGCLLYDLSQVIEAEGHIDLTTLLAEHGFKIVKEEDD